MPPQYSSISSRALTPAGASTTPGFLTRPDTEKLRRPLRALLHDVAHPVERLDVLLERRATEQADLGHVRRAMPGQAALALDRLDHRGFFTADVRAGAAAQMHARVLGETRALDLGDLVGEHQPHLGIFVADVDVDVRRLDHPGRDQHAFDEAVRVLLEVVAVL